MAEATTYRLPPVVRWLLLAVAAARPMLRDDTERALADELAVALVAASTDHELAHTAFRCSFFVTAAVVREATA